MIFSCTSNNNIPFDYKKVPEFDGFNYQNKQGVVYTWDKFDNAKNLIYRCNLMNRNIKSLKIDGNCKDFLSDNLELFRETNFSAFENQLVNCTVIYQENDSLKITTCRSQGLRIIKTFPIDQIKLNPLETFSNKISEFDNLQIAEVYNDNDLVKYSISPNYIFRKIKTTVKTNVLRHRYAFRIIAPPDFVCFIGGMFFASLRTPISSR